MKKNNKAELKTILASLFGVKTGKSTLVTTVCLECSFSLIIQISGPNSKDRYLVKLS